LSNSDCFSAQFTASHPESRPEVSNTFADTTYFQSLRLEPYYLYTAQNITAAAGFLNALARETQQHKESLVHGDFSPKNTLIYRDKLIRSITR
jgi:hypothetical protein